MGGGKMSSKDLMRSELRVLRLIDAGPFHTHRVKGMRTRDREIARRLCELRLVRELPAKGRFPARFALSTKGSHATDTFAFTKLWG